MYNSVQKDRQLQESDVLEAAKYNRELQSNDPSLFWTHKVGLDARLLHLF